MTTEPTPELPALPSLPPFEGRTPDTAAVSFTGGVESNPPHIDAMHHGQHVAFLVLGDIGDVTHGTKGGEKDQRFVRGHKVVVDRVIPLNPQEAKRVYDVAIERINAENPTPGTLDDVLNEVVDAINDGALGPDVSAARS